MTSLRAVISFTCTAGWIGHQRHVHRRRLPTFRHPEGHDAFNRPHHDQRHHEGCQRCRARPVGRNHSCGCKIQCTIARMGYQGRLTNVRILLDWQRWVFLSCLVFSLNEKHINCSYLFVSGYTKPSHVTLAPPPIPPPHRPPFVFPRWSGRRTSGVRTKIAAMPDILQPLPSTDAAARDDSPPNHAAGKCRRWLDLPTREN